MMRLEKQKKNMSIYKYKLVFIDFSLYTSITAADVSIIVVNKKIIINILFRI
jgi:hypothetical protein